MSRKRNIQTLQNKAQTTPKKADLKNVIKIPQQLFRITTDMQKYRNAVQWAENIHNPNRYDLLQLYQQTMLDPHVTACFQQLKNMILSCDFNIYNKEGKEDEDKTRLIETKWFRDYLELCMEAPMYGFTLIQFEDIITKNGQDEFKDIEQVPRMYVRPEKSYVVYDTAAQPPAGVDFRDTPYSNWSMFVGSKHDLGLLLKITPLVIWKKNAMGAWAEFIEKFGSPVRIGKTDSTDLQTVNNMEGMLRNMGTAAWGIFKLDEEIEFIETKHQDAYEVFDKMIDRCNSEISKLILGQTGTTDEKSFVGSAEVHERISKMNGEYYKQFIYNCNNSQLLPLMNNLGFGLEGFYIDIEQESEFDLKQKSEFDIALLNTGMYKFTREYLKEKYGTEVEEVERAEPIDKKEVENYKNVLSKYYS